MKVLRDEPLAPRTTLGIGGPARTLYEVDDEAELLAVSLAVRETPLLVLGGGSNVVISDQGVDEPVICWTRRGRSTRALASGRVEVTVQGGEPWDEVVFWTVAENLAGLECLSGIPGWTGAAPVQNIGAYGQAISNTITRVRCLDIAAQTIRDLPAAACGFGYRRSIFKQAAIGRYVILAVVLQLERAAPRRSTYPELSTLLGDGPATLADIRAAVLTLRRKKSMVVDPADCESRSVGSFFLNPLVPPATADQIEQLARAQGTLQAEAVMPRFPLPPEDAPQGQPRVKLSAAWLIEQAGFPRGYQRGAVGLSCKHALAIVNRGGATAAEVLALATAIRQGVAERFAVTLQPEPVFWGSLPFTTVPIRP